MKFFNTVFSHPVLQANPPILIDIGASKHINRKWKQIAQYSVCIAFDADDRDFNINTINSKTFKQLHTFNAIVTDNDIVETDFYLTKSPYCSSILQPNNKELSDWAFAKKFDIEKIIKIKSINLSSVISQLNISQIDWFKCDSQGTDLRLFKSLSPDIISKVIVAEFEPGFIDAYFEEDKFYTLLKFMEEHNFLFIDAKLKGSQFLSDKLLNEFIKSEFLKKFLQYSHKSSPGWIEAVFFNKLNNSHTVREYLLGWVFATINQQYGLALKIAKSGSEQFKDSLFNEMKNESVKSIKFNLLNRNLLSTVITKLRNIFCIE